MAVDPHLRFPNVDEFEKALLKEKRVLNVVKEKRRRRKNRLIGVLSAVLVVAIGLSIFSYQYNQQKLAETLPDSTIELWYVLPGSEVNDKAKTASFKEIIKIFNKSFPNVTVNLVAYKKDEYVEKINAAYKKDELPPLFESTGLDQSIIEKSMDLSKAVKTVDSDKVLFFNNYNKAFPNAKQFPTGFIVPIKYTNSAPNSKAKTDGNERERFLAGATGEYIGSSADFYDVVAALGGKYKISPHNGGSSLCEFADLWSMGNCDKDQQKVINRLLVFLLYENAQDFLHIRYRSGSLPLNEKTLISGEDPYVSTYADFDGFFDNLSDFNFSKN